MGDRGNIVIRFPDDQRIYLYTHHDGSRAHEIVADAIARVPRDRWSDGGMLARVVFARLLGADPAGLYGAYITPTRALSDHDELHVDVERRVVRQVAIDVLWGPQVETHERVVGEWGFDELRADPEVVPPMPLWVPALP